MKLLVITQKVDLCDPVLGFFHGWLEEFAKNTEKLTVICLEKGNFDLPENVKVLSLGKDEFKIQNSKFKIPRRILYIIRFYYLIWKLRREYDAVFVHMNPEYVTLGWAVWKFLGKKVSLWYVHKSVNFKLRIAEKLSDKIFTASPESFRLPSKKVEVVGHGIDTEKFQITDHKPQTNSEFTIITAGRISPVKNLEILIGALEVLKNSEVGFELKIAGGPVVEEDKIYFERLKSLVSEKGLEDAVFFSGPITHYEIQDFYAKGDIFVNLSDTGSLDKAVLEAMASGLSVITSNEAFRDILPDKYFLKSPDTDSLSGKIKDISSENRPNLELRDMVVKNHSLEVLIKKIIYHI